MEVLKPRMTVGISNWFGESSAKSLDTSDGQTLNYDHSSTTPFLPSHFNDPIRSEMNRLSSPPARFTLEPGAIRSSWWRRVVVCGKVANVCFAAIYSTPSGNRLPPSLPRHCCRGEAPIGQRGWTWAPPSPQLGDTHQRSHLWLRPRCCLYSSRPSLRRQVSPRLSPLRRAFSILLETRSFWIRTPIFDSIFSS